MSQDPLRQACVAVLHQIAHRDTDWKCCLEDEESLDILLAFAKAQQAAGVREARRLYLEWITPGYHEEMTFERTLEQRAEEHER